MPFIFSRRRRSPCQTFAAKRPPARDLACGSRQIGGHHRARRFVDQIARHRYRGADGFGLLDGPRVRALSVIAGDESVTLLGPA